MPERHPDLAVQILPVGSREAIEMIEQGDADLALVSHVTRPTDHAVCVPLYHWNLVGLLPRGQELTAHGGPLAITDLAEAPLVTYDSMLERDSSFTDVFREAGVEPNLAFTAPDTDTVKTYARAGMGLGILAEFAIGHEDQDLSVIDLQGLFPTRTTWAVMSRRPTENAHLMDALGLILPSLDIAKIKAGKEAFLHALDWRDMNFTPHSIAQMKPRI